MRVFFGLSGKEIRSGPAPAARWTSPKNRYSLLTPQKASSAVHVGSVPLAVRASVASTGR